jgi:hypothetical protein
MLALAILAGVFLLIVAYSTSITRRFSFPESYAFRPASLDLPDAERERVERWGRALEAKGFARVGDFRLDLELGAGVFQVERKRVWLSADRTTWAVSRHLSVLRSGGGAELARSFRALAFNSALPSGGFVSTHNNRAVVSSFIQDPESSVRACQGLEDVELLHEAHLRHLKEANAAPSTSDGDLLALERAAWTRLTERARAQGYLERRDGLWRSTLKLALRTSLRGLNPFMAEGGRPGAVAARLAGLAAGAALVAAPLAEAPGWAPAILFGAAAAVACVLFPALPQVSWVLAMLPAHLILDASGGSTAWGWIAGTLTTLVLIRPIEAARFRRAARSLARPDAGPPPLGRGARIAWGLGIAASALAGAGLLVWIRAPRSGSPLNALGVLVLAVAICGILLASIAADFIGSLRGSAVKRTLDRLALCGLLLFAGLAGGVAFAALDEKASQAAADVVVARLEARRAETGAFPATLAELGELPKPRFGWGPSAFTYWKATPDGYMLTWPSARGPRWASKPSFSP